MDIVLFPAGKTETDTSAIRLCTTLGRRITQMKNGAACPT
jgi:type IV fimbrial biogenesis protein FimT